MIRGAETKRKHTLYAIDNSDAAQTYSPYVAMKEAGHEANAPHPIYFAK